MDSEYFHKLKNATVISVMIQAIITIVEHIINSPYISLVFVLSEEAQNDWSENVYLKSALTIVYGALLLGVILKEYFCLLTFFLVLQVLNALGVLLFVIVTPFLVEGHLNFFYFTLHIFVALVIWITTGILIVYFSKLRLVHREGFADQPNENKSAQTVSYKASDSSVIP